MSNKQIFQKDNAITYIIAVLFISWLVEIAFFINPSVGEKYFGLVMFIPAITVVIINKIKQKSDIKRHKSITEKLNLKSLLFAVLYPIGFVILCAVLTELIGIGKLNFSKLTSINYMVIMGNIIIGSFGAFGEEYGWRGYLLPALTKTKGKIKATIIVGIVWALYHMPVVFLLAKTTGMTNPLFVCLIQTGCVFVFSFSFSYCYYLSESIIPVIIYHSVWNTINTTVLGDIYTNKQGVLEGNLLLINGESCIGLIIGTVIAYWFIKEFKKNNLATEVKFNI